jgi:hypothetical protein
MDGGQVRERGVRAEMGAAADGGAAAAADGGEAGRFLEVGRFLEAAADGGSLRRRRIGVRRRRMGCRFLAGQWVSRRWRWRTGFGCSVGGGAPIGDG